MIVSKRTLFVLILLLISTILFSQEIKKGDAYTYARKIVDTLSSYSMHGRGYVNGGDSIAANYIKNEFKSFGLRAFGEDYYQKLTFSINTFPDSVYMSIDGRKLFAGADYIVFAHSPTSSGTYPVAIANDELVNNNKRFKKFIKQDFSKKIVFVNDTGKETPELHTMLGNDFKAKAVVALKDKLTWSTAQTLNTYPLIEVLRTPLNDHPKEISFYIGNKFIPNHPSQNVIGYIKGSVYPDSFIVFTAHYDHLGQMGWDVYFPGANDNASGCAMLLNLAKYYSLPENAPKCSVAFIAFCGEEVGLIGSKYYVEHPLFPLKQIKFLLNMDIMGTGEEGITVVNGTIYKKEFDKLKEINTENHFIKDVKIRGKAANSDHYYFGEAGVHACFIYTMGGIKAYHDVYDRAETLPLNEFQNLFELITKFGAELQNEF